MDKINLDSFFNNDEGTVPEQPVQTPEQIEKIKLGEEEYTQEELSKLVGLGRSYQDIESRYNTKVDRILPEFTKATQRIKSLEEELELEKKAKQYQTPVDPENEQSVKEARAAAKKLGIVTQEDFDDYMAKSFRKYFEVERQTEKLIDQAKSLEETYNGSDGRPKFVFNEVIDYMETYGVKNPEVAYKLMHERELDSWKEKKIADAKKPGLVTSTPTGLDNKTPKDIRPDKGNLKQLISEQLGN